MKIFGDKKFLAIIFSFLMAFLLAGTVSATNGDAKSELKKRLEGAGVAATLATGDETVLARTIGGVISVFLGFLGVIGLVIVIYAGYLWLTAGGNTEQVDKAKSLLRNGVIGLIIISLAFAITNFVITQIIEAGKAPPPPAEPAQPLPGGPQREPEFFP